jgi:uncharacterized protein
MGSDEPSPVAAPVATRDRLLALDLIRGIAVLGILLANITAFAHPDLAYYWPPALPGGGNAADRWIWLAQFVAVDGKLRALFTVLFGAGLVLFFERLGAEEHAVAVQLRRLLWLLVFGLAHFFLLFSGDILFTYACAGLIALPFLRMEGEKAIVLALIWLVVAGGMQMLSYATPMMVEAGTAAETARQATSTIYQDYWAEELAEAASQAQVMAGPDGWQVIAWRVREHSGDLVGYFSWIFFETVPLILLGMGLYRLGLFHASDKEGPPRWQRLWWAWGLLVAGLGLTLWTGLWALRAGFPPYLTNFVYFGTAPLTNLPLTVGLVVLVARWAVRATARDQPGWLVERLMLAGRMAFSNYIGTSVVMMLLFQGWAGGLYGTMHRLDLLLVVVFGWALMITCSRLWLARFRYGPLEYLWRCLTYWRLFPNRLSPG